MTSEEKRAWILGLMAIGTYAVYVTIILRRAQTTPITEVPYASTLLWTVGISIVASIVLHILVTIFSPEHAEKKDQRDREISRFGEHIGQSFVVIGATGALLMAMAKLEYFWIANVIYLCFVLSAIVSSIAKIAAYRWGFQKW
jgi:hypothetical protein